MATIDELMQLLDQQDVAIRQAFINFVTTVRSPAMVDRLTTMLQSGDIDGALQIIDSHIAQFANVIPEVVRQVGTATAVELAEKLPEIAMAIVFDSTNPRAADLIASSRMDLIQQISAQQEATIRQAVSRVVRNGGGPAEMARAFRDSIGLTTAQEDYVQTYRAGLESLNAGALDRALRDRRFDGSVQSALDANRALPDSQIDMMVGRYRDNAIASRAETIGRTEALTAYSQGREEALQQMTEQAAIDSNRITRVWHSIHDDRVREWHAVMEGQEAGMYEPFTDGLGNALMFPGDPLAPPETTINCFPGSVRILAAGTKRVIERHYSGELVELSFAGRIDLAVTPNHPILTKSGWRRADDISEGDELVYCRLADDFIAPQPNIEHRQARAERLAYLARVGGRADRPHGAVVNLHGEALVDQEVEVVTPPSSLRERWQAAGREIFDQFGLVSADAAEIPLLAQRLVGEPLDAIDSSARAVRRRGQFSPLIGRHGVHADSIGFADSALGKPKIDEARVDNPASASEPPSYLLDRNLLTVKDLHPVEQRRSLFLIVRVTATRKRFHSGPVYNFETDTGIIIAEGIVSHNCRCTTTYEIAAP